jgi:hypothetical protein
MFELQNGQKLRPVAIATHPFDKHRAGCCKKRKKGAPSVGMVHAKIVEGGPPAPGQSLLLCAGRQTNDY